MIVLPHQQKEKKHPDSGFAGFSSSMLLAISFFSLLSYPI